MSMLEGREGTYQLSAEELRQMLATGQPVAVLDVRPLAERLEWQIPGSMHADVYEDL